MWKKQPTCPIGSSIDWCKHCGDKCGNSQNSSFKFHLSHVPLLGIFPKQSNASHHSDIGMPMSIAAQFVVVNSWKQSKYLSANEWIQKICSFYTMN